MINTTEKGGLVLVDKEDSYTFGTSNNNPKIDTTPIFPNGIQTKYRAKNEMQCSRYFDTWNCVAYSASNAIDAFMNYLIEVGSISDINMCWLEANGYLEDGIFNSCERYLGIRSGTEIGVGNTFKTVAHAAHEWGVAPGDIMPYPFEMKKEEYYYEDPETFGKATMLALDFNDRFHILYENFWMKDIKKVMNYATVQVGVNAWYKDGDGLYYNPKPSTNHAVRGDELHSMMIDSQLVTRLDKIQDSYEPYIKQLVPDYNFCPTGYLFVVQEQLKETMDIEGYLEANDLKWIRNERTGQFGRIMQGFLQTVDPDSRATLMLFDARKRENGRGVSQEEWDALPKKSF